MFSRNSINPFPCDVALYAHINGDYDNGDIKKINWVEHLRKSFGVMPSPNIPGLAIALNKNFPSPTAE